MIIYCSLGIVIFAVLLAFVRATVLEGINATWRRNEGKMISRLMGGRWVWGALRKGETNKEVINEKAEVSKEGRREGVTDEDGRQLTFESTLQAPPMTMEKRKTSQSIGGYEIAISELRRERAKEFRSQVRRLLGSGNGES